MECQPLLENQFKPIITDNYYGPSHFWFELDHAQTNKLISLLASQAVASRVPQFTTKWRTFCTGLSSLETSDGSDKIKPEILEEHFDLASQVSDTVDVNSSLDAGNRAFEAHFDANLANEEEEYRIFLKLQQLATNHHESSLPLTSDTECTTSNKDTNLENKGNSGEPIESKDNNEEDCGSSTELQSLMAKVVTECIYL